MKKLSFILLSISLIAFSCNKDIIDAEDGQAETSFTMTFNGQTYTEVNANSLSLINGSIGIVGAEGNEFSLRIIGLGADGTTTNICSDYECENMCTVTLDFGDRVGLEGLTATSGTIKRTGKKIEVNVEGISMSLETKPLSATIVVAEVIDL